MDIDDPVMTSTTTTTTTTTTKAIGALDSRDGIPRCAFPTTAKACRLPLTLIWQRIVSHHGQLMHVAIAPSGLLYPDGPVYTERQKANARTNGKRATWDQSRMLAPAVVVASDTGVLVVVDPVDPNADIVLDAKSSCITALMAAPLMPPAGCDLVVCDNEGSLNIICRQRTVFRRLGGSVVSALGVSRKTDGAVEILTGDSEGRITAFSCFDEKWSLKVGGLGLAKDSFDDLHQTAPIAALLVADLTTDDGELLEHILVCDGSSNLYIIKDRNVTMKVPTPCPIYSMCQGYFWANDSSANKSRPSQVLLGGDDGNIYLLHRFQIYHYATIDYTITRLIRVRPPQIPTDETDAVLCTGEFAELRVYHNGQCVNMTEIEDFPQSVSVNSNDHSVAILLPDTIVEVHSLLASPPPRPPPLTPSAEDERKRTVLKAILRAAEARTPDPSIFEGLLAGNVPTEAGELEEGMVED